MKDLKISGAYALKSLKHFGLFVFKVCITLYQFIKKYPFIAIAIVIALSTLFNLIQIGKVRAERDSLSVKLYLANEKIEQASKLYGK